MSISGFHSSEVYSHFALLFLDCVGALPENLPNGILSPRYVAGYELASRNLVVWLEVAPLEELLAGLELADEVVAKFADEPQRTFVQSIAMSGSKE